MQGLGPTLLYAIAGEGQGRFSNFHDPGGQLSNLPQVEMDRGKRLSFPYSYHKMEDEGGRISIVALMPSRMAHLCL